MLPTNNETVCMCRGGEDRAWKRQKEKRWHAWKMGLKGDRAHLRMKSEENQVLTVVKEVHMKNLEISIWVFSLSRHVCVYVLVNVQIIK